jgi:hypothetical protein
MIKTGNLVILAVALVALLGVSLVQKNTHRSATNQSSLTELVAPGLVSDDLIRITLGFGDQDEAVVLGNTPTGWTVDTAWQAKASPPRIEALVSSLAGLGGEYRSASADVLDDYGLGAGSALRIRAFNPAGETVVALDVGNKPEGAQGNFVRKPDSDKVYVSQTSLLSQVGIYGNPEAPASRYFVDLQAVQVDRLDVDRIVVTDGGQTLDLVKVLAEEPAAAPDSLPTHDRNTWEWQLAGRSATALAKTKVDALLNTAVAIRANDLVDPGADLATYGLAAPGRRLELHLQDTRVVTLNFGDSRAAAGQVPAGTFMQVDGERTVWVVTEYAMKNLFKTLAELQPE